MKIQDCQFLVLDIETTGLDPTSDKIVEIAAIMEKKTFQALCHPGREIPPAASAIHHITNEMVKDKRPFMDYYSELVLEMKDANVLVGHNIVGFDDKFLPDHKWPILDTMLLAKKVWPDMESYSNQFLRYYHKLYLTDGVGRSAHEALSDVKVTSGILKKLLDDVCAMKVAAGQDPDNIQVEDLIKWSLVPNLLKTCKFGKHKGKPWAEIPLDYLRWMKDNLKDMDADTLFTVGSYLTMPSKLFPVR